MIYLLDTNICIYIIKKAPPHVFEKLKDLSPDLVGISAITEAELRYGMSNSSRPRENHRVLDDFLSPLRLFQFDSKAANHYGEIRTFLKNTGMPIGYMDTLIAAHARCLSSTLVTNNVEEFGRVPGLRVENWA